MASRLTKVDEINEAEANRRLHETVGGCLPPLHQTSAIMLSVLQTSAELSEASPRRTPTERLSVLLMSDKAGYTTALQRTAL